MSCLWELEVQPEFVAELDSMLGQRNITKDGTMLQKWKGISVKNITWKDDAVIHSQFLELSLKDKAYSTGGSHRCYCFLYNSARLD